MPLILPDLFQDLLALFYPTLCLACDEALVSGEQHFCTECRVKLPYLTHHLPNPTASAATSPLARRFWGKVEIRHTLAYLQFAPRGRVQRLLHRLKYDDQPEIGQVLGQWFGAELEQVGYAQEFDALIPVPMHPAKERRRGYNQATCYAEGLADGLGLPVWPTALLKMDDGVSQTRKNRLERWQNVSGGFTLGPEPERLFGKHLLIVDDVLTTGATLEACANVLLAAGAQTVSVCTIASAGS